MRGAVFPESKKVKVIQVLYHSLSPYKISKEIVHYEDGFHARWGEALQRYKPYEISVECWRPEAAIRKEMLFNKRGVTHRIFPSIRINGRDMPFSMWLELKRLSKKEKFILHLHGLFNPTTYALSVLIKDAAIVVQALTRHNFKPSFKDAIKNRIFSNIDHLLVITEEDRIFLKSLYSIDEISVMPGSPVDFDLFKVIDKDIAKSKLSLERGKRYILFVGRLDEAKGLNYLLEGFDIIRERLKDIDLLFVGDGPFKERLIEMARRLKILDYIKFIGQVKNTLLPFYYNASDLFVLPSLNEGVPVAVVEAMACGLPIIGMPIEGIRQIMNNFDGGLSVPSLDSKTLADAIEKVLKNPGQFAAKDIMRARGYYHGPYVIERLFNIYKKLWQKIS